MKDPVTKLAFAIVAGIVLIFAALILTAKSCHGQPFKLREHIAPAALIFASGAFEGGMDHLQFHYDKQNKFWNPDISWRNKYKGGDPANGKTFAGKYFVAATDGWHLLKLGRNATLFTGLILRIGDAKRKWYWLILEGAGYWAVNRAGFNFSYYLLDK